MCLELGRVWTGSAVAYFKVNSRHLSENTEECVIGMDFELDNSVQLCRLILAHVILIKPFYTF